MVASRTEIKQRMLALQALGEALVKLSPGQLEAIPLEGELKEAILAARTTKTRGGLRRQLQFVGKLMRNTDIEAIEQAYQDLLEGRKTSAENFHALELWRDRLVEQGPDLINEFVAKYPSAERQRLRQLINSARKEKELEKPPASSRKLFRYIREVDEEQRSDS